MKKNVIVILVDSIFSDCIGNRRTEESSTPFIDSLIPNCLFADNVYSYGPHTDAASKGLYCGNRSLDDYGYFFGMNSSNYNIHRLFKDNGYETYAMYYPYYFIGPKSSQYIDNIIFTSGFIWSSVWFGKYEYYADILKSRSLTKVEYKIIEKLTDLLFELWMDFYLTIDINPESERIIKPLKDGTDGKAALILEFEKYKKNKEKYILDLLKCGYDHPLSRINDYNTDLFVDKSFLKKIYSDHKDFFRMLSRVNFSRNIRNNKLRVLRGLKELFTQGVKNSEIVRWLMCLYAPAQIKSRSLKTRWMFEPSFLNQINVMFDQLDKRTSDDRPFFFSMHTEDAHQNISFFTYDLNDDSVINEELNYLKPLISNCGKEYKGNLTYQLSLCYIDLCVKRVFERLQERNLLDKTSIILAVDHGSSFTGFPVRDYVVNNFHVENYKTPFMVWNPDSSFNGYYGGKYSADMLLPTICKCLDFPIPEDISKTTIIDMPNGKPYIITEYMGCGCPDMISREVWMSIRDEHYCIGYKSRIDKEFNIDSPYCIYDLLNDVNEYTNLAGTEFENKEDVIYLKNEIKVRFEEIQSQTDSILSDLDGLRVTL